jgi:hypothetical protein
VTGKIAIAKCPQGAYTEVNASIKKFANSSEKLMAIQQ